MKKFVTMMLCVLLCAASAFGMAACRPKSDPSHDEFSVYAPDGAPALALANLISRDVDTEGVAEDVADRGFTFKTTIVNATTIQTYVTGENPKADFCILPVNAAGKFLGTGEVYQMLGTVTNGNLYFLKDGSKDLPDLTKDNLAEVLPGKTMGVIQYEQVPGLTLRIVLNEYDVSYEVGTDATAGKLTISPCAPEQVVPATGYDYYLCPEPAATSKIGATKGALAAAGSLQTLYGEDGYPQAVLVAKKSVIETHSEAVETILAAMQGAGDFLKTVSAHELASLLEGKRTAGMDAAFSEAQLNATVLANCSVRFTKAADCKEAVVEFLTKFKSVSAASTEVPQDAFFYQG